jgi:hypothetical protein
VAFKFVQPTKNLAIYLFTKNFQLNLNLNTQLIVLAFLQTKIQAKTNVLLAALDHTNKNGNNIIILVWIREENKKKKLKQKE